MRTFSRSCRLLWPALALLVQPVAAQTGPANAPGTPPTAAPASPATNMPERNSGAVAQTRPGGPVTLNFVNADVEAVARAMGSILGKQVVVDPRVKGTLNLSTDQPVPSQTAYNQFLAVLRLQGFAVVESAGLLKVVPEAEAKLQTGVANISNGSSAGAPGSSQIVTQIFRLNHENAANLVPVLRPLISPNNTINHNPGNNSLVITDYADNLQRMARIISAMDVSNGSDVEVVPLKHAIASDLAVLVSRLIEPSSTSTAGAPSGGTDTALKTTVLAEPRANALIVRAANPARVALVKSLIDKLDQPTAGGSPSGNIYVVYLKNADASKLAATLRGILTGQVSNPSSTSSLSGSSSAPSANALGSSAASGSFANTSQAAQTPGQIQADTATNALIITAPEPQYRQLRAVIDKLDMRRAQVFVESLIAEVNSDRAAEIGIQWQGPIGKAGDAAVGLIGTNFGSGARNIFTLSQGATTPAAGLNVGVAQSVNGVYVLGFLGRLLEQNGDGNVLSTPNLLTLDNEEAKIVVGQNVPFLTGQYSNATSGTGVVNPFQTIERRDVGLTLRVKPQISENGTVKLQIFQEVSSVDATTLNSTSGVTTNKRSIESNVLVQDGSVVVLGGLLQDQYASDQSRVPGLADLPIVGGLFRSETRSRKKTNLMVFLRPVVLRDADSLENLAQDRYSQMRGAQNNAQPTPSSIMPINGAPVLPPIERGDTPAAAPGASPSGAATGAAPSAASPAAAQRAP